MDGSTYINIFDTKGIEYLVIIAFLLLLIPFWLLLNKKARISRKMKRSVARYNSAVSDVPFGYFYANNHTWAFLGKTGSATIGVDDLLLRVTGPVMLNYMKGDEEIIRKGEPMAQITRGKKTLVLKSPISGMFLHGNPLLADSPEFLDEDPYGAGWVCRIRPSDWKADTGSFYLAEEATRWFRDEMGLIRDFMAEHAGRQPGNTLPVVLQDGGEIYDGALSDMPMDCWTDFQKEFLDR